MKNYDYYYLAKRNLLGGASERKRTMGQVKPGMKVHVSAVCGKAMASVACLLKEFGCEVTGSDSQFSPPMSDVLDAHQIAKLEPSAKNVEGIDLLVVGNAMRYDSLEIVSARAKNLPMISGAEAVAQIFAEKRSLVVAGTHGKTTTSALLTHILREALENPAYMIGGVFQGTDDSYNIGDSKSRFVVYEGDEYNCAFFDQAPKFLRYDPRSVILTSIEQDHIDLYPTNEDYRQAFQFLVDELPNDGFLVIHESAARQLNLEKCQAKIQIYNQNSYQIKATSSYSTKFALTIEEFKNLGDLELPMFGSYNVENAVAVTILATLEGLKTSQIKQGLANFPGTKERQELLGTKTDGTVVIRDYAHHPTAVSLTLEGIRSHFPNSRLTCIFEPKSASSRRKIFEEQYAKSLGQADTSIVISPALKPTDNKETAFDAESVVTMIRNSGAKSFASPSNKEALHKLRELVSPGDVVVFMSSGDMDDIDHDFLKL